MKNRYTFVLLFCALAGIGCTPDLVVESLTCDGAARTAAATIKNAGNANAGEFLVYVNADENPESQNDRPQVRKQVTGLAQGQTVVVQADFGPLASPDNSNLHNVFQITAIVDPKGTVKESNEGNNARSIACHF